MSKNHKILIFFFILTFLISSMMGGLMGFAASVVFMQDNSKFEKIVNKIIPNADIHLANKINNSESITRVVDEESATISVVEKASPAVVSIIVTKDLPVIERYYDDSDFGDSLFEEFFGSGFGDFFRTPSYRQNGTETQEVGGGTGFLVSEDGYIITNKHVVSDRDADYTVLMNNQDKHEANVLARDYYNDLAILKIEGDSFPFIELGDSDNLKVGQSVVAIGNSLGEFSNTVSTGIVSGLARNVTAGGIGRMSEELVDVIQTDASINPGNSGGPLLNLSGQVIGINTAIAADAENICFALPVNSVNNILESVKTHGKIVRPWLGVRYVMLNEEIASENNLDYDYGALIVRGEERSDLAVVPGSPADKAGLVENDIILEVNGEKINESNPLAQVIGKYSPGEEIELKIFHKDGEKTIKLSLDEMDDI